MDAIHTSRHIPQVLIVDDDREIRQTAATVLEQEGFEVYAADNGEHAVLLFKSMRPDIVLLDVLMPVLDGYDACRAMRDLDPGGNVPILMLTSPTGSDSAERAFDTGATDFITKPISWTLLAHRIRYALRSSSVSKRLRTSQSRLRHAMSLARLGHWRYVYDSGVIYLSDELCAMFDLQADASLTVAQVHERLHPADRSLVQQHLDQITDRGEAQHLEFRIALDDGDERMLAVLAEQVLDADGRPCEMFGVAQDITERRRIEDRLAYLNHYESLTGLPNRVLFRDRLQQSMLEARDRNHLLGILFVDVDRFREINRTLGHEIGDRLLRGIAQRLQEHQEALTTLSHRGGDEFLVLLPTLGHPEDLARTARGILGAFSEPFRVREHELYLTASIGMAMYPTDEAGPDELLRSAGVAMYRAKEFGGNTFQYYRSDMNVRAMERLATEAALHQALGNKELKLRFQPQLDLQTGRPDGAEVLMRWDRPGHGLVPPKDFIPMMEESGLILSTGEWVLAETLQQIQTWRAAGMAPLRISVNLSGRQFNDPALIDSVHRVLDESGVEPALVEFEITETTLMQDVDRAIATMLYFKTLGIQLAIDDFGTGYSSLAYLKNLPVSTLKLDRSFVHGIGGKDKGNTAIVRSTIDLAHNLGLDVVAEGVDNAAEFRLLKEFGCDRAQGNFIAPPLSASEFPTWLIGHDPSNSAQSGASEGGASTPPAT